jgi:hypothetical protein
MLEIKTKYIRFKFYFRRMYIFQILFLQSQYLVYFFLNNKIIYMYVFIFLKMLLILIQLKYTKELSRLIKTD